MFPIGLLYRRTFCHGGSRPVNVILKLGIKLQRGSFLAHIAFHPSCQVSGSLVRLQKQVLTEWPNTTGRLSGQVVALRVSRSSRHFLSCWPSFRIPHFIPRKNTRHTYTFLRENLHSVSMEIFLQYGIDFIFNFLIFISNKQHVRVHMLPQKSLYKLRTRLFCVNGHFFLNAENWSIHGLAFLCGSWCGKWGVPKYGCIFRFYQVTMCCGDLVRSTKKCEIQRWTRWQTLGTLPIPSNSKRNLWVKRSLKLLGFFVYLLI